MTLKRHFEHAFSVGQRVENSYVRIQFCSPFVAETCVAFVAPKRFGNAVKRNSAKRRLRELYRLCPPQDPINADMILIAKWALLTCSFETVKLQYATLLDRVRRKTAPRGQLA